jgi:hypothetical protein
MHRWRATGALLLLALAGAAIAQGAAPPRTLHETGFGTSLALPFAPQYPLWSDGADKQRWIALPPGTAIDASNPDAWVFPIGTRLWKQFSHAGQPVEMRYSERLADGSWRFATYVWSAGGSDAVLAPARGIAALPVPAAPGGRYAVPSASDCLACHGGAAAPVLGFGALQLATMLPMLAERGLVRGLPNELLHTPPRIAASSSAERAALGYLHGNCAHCHHDAGGQVPVRLNLMQRVADAKGSAAAALRSMVAVPSRFQPGEGRAMTLVPGDASASLIVQRMRVRDARVQMPPLGTDHVDAEALSLLVRWIEQDIPSQTPRKTP